MRLFGLVKDIALANLRDPALPFKLTFILTYRCQLRCSMCGIWKREDEGELTVDEIRRFLRASRFSWVNVSGGEIFLRADVDEVFAAIVEECPRLFVLDFPTHGYQTDRIVASTERLLARGVPRILVTVSIDGPESVHDRIRGIDGSWERAVGTFARLREMRRRVFRPSLGMTLQPDNVHLVDDTVASIRARIPGLTHRELHVNLGHVSPHYYANQEFAPAEPADALAALDRIREGRGRSLHPEAWIERRYHTLARRFLREGHTPLPCHAAAASVFVDSMGNVYPCSIWDRRIANLRDHGYDLGAILRAPEATRVRTDARRGRCPQCWTPCEAFPTILARVLPRPGPRGRTSEPVSGIRPGRGIDPATPAVGQERRR